MFRRRPSPAAAAVTVPSPFVRECEAFCPTQLAATIHLAVIGSLLAVWQPAAQAQTATPAANQRQQATAMRTYDIPAGPLAAALARFASETGVLLAATPELVQGKTSPGVRGTFSVQAALDALLAGTGVAARRNAQGGYVLVTAEPGTLPAITVSAATYLSTPLDYLAGDSTAGALGDKPVLDTPFSITVVNSKDIAERGARSVGQIFRNDASVYSPSPSFTTVWWGTSIRGLGVHNYYVDGIPMTLNWGGDFPTEAVESVSALKGLTGFMYGFGDPGGAISYHLKRPTATPMTTLNLGYRNPSLFSMHVDTSHNVGKQLGIRLNVAADKGTAFNASEPDRKVASLAIDMHFGDSVTWHNNFIYEDNKLKAEPIVFYLNPGTGSTAYDAVGSGGKLPEVTYDYDDFNIDNSYYNTKTKFASTGLDWQINDQWTLNYQLGFARKNHESNKAFADLKNRGGDYAGIIYNFAGTLDDLFTQLMLQGSVTTVGIEHDLVAGFGWRRDKRSYSTFYWSNDFNGNLYVEQDFRTTRTPDFSTGETRYEDERRYAFASDTVKFNDHWQAIIGARFTDYEQKDVDHNPSVDSGFKNRAISPTLALIYKPDANTSLYGSYVEALQPGQVVSGFYANAGEVLDPTVSKQYELGVKHVSGKAAYSTALFRIEQANLMAVGSSPTTLTQNGRGIYNGIELSGSYLFTDDLNLGLSAILLNASIDKTDDPSVKGNVPAGVSDWQLVTFVEYKVPAVQGLKLRGNVRYFGDAYVDDGNAVKAPGYTLVNVGFSYEFGAWNQGLVLTGNIYNLLNEKYWASSNAAASAPLNVGAERNMSLGLSIKF